MRLASLLKTVSVVIFLHLSRSSNSCASRQTQRKDFSVSSSSSSSSCCVTSHKTNETLSEIRRRWFPAQDDVHFTIYELNVSASNALPVDRELPDFRPPECDRKWSDDPLPDVSVVIPVFNEAWSMLLRALHSIVKRTPGHLLREIIIVDDASTYEYLDEPLMRYTALLSDKIRILRQRQREGLIRARLRGASEARGQVLVFLDGHTEVNVGWLEPLLVIIRENRTVLALPQVDSIDVNSIEYLKWNYVAHGGFTWHMNYIWKYLPEAEAASNRKFPAEPFRSPTALGCALAIDRRFFHEIGSFDDGMYIWGGENIELSFRTWLCGGSIYVAPCSRVGHSFRRWLPYSFPESFGGVTVKRLNYQRLVDVWLEDYSKYYYAANGRLPSNLLDESYRRSLAARQRLRRRLKCRHFSWFMDNIVPEMAVPDEDATHFGQLANLAGRDCVTSSTDGGFLSMTSCGWHDRDRSFSYTKESTIRSSRRNPDGKALCLTALSEGYAALESCVRGQVNQRWTFDWSAWTPKEEAAYRAFIMGGDEPTQRVGSVGKLVASNDVDTRVCLSQVTLPSGRQITGLLECDVTTGKAQFFQFWHFTYNFQQRNDEQTNSPSGPTKRRHDLL